MNENQIKFLEALKAELQSQSFSAIGPNDHPVITSFVVGGRILDAIKKLLSSIDLSGMTRDEFLAVVGQAYDTVIAPMFVTMGPMGPMLSMMVRGVVLHIAGVFYDNHTKHGA
jgi:hypothetical protein